ncbi:hypothetical protein TPHA_0A05110 [Tetrapisispora phaffii CBS 4417]|uniref:BRCT domain-containing protein n=1 Tax=Tetrapisispora phaffii (strain ATCC 24235 / CBS 4417 / NBRC 1672 / NRRL Y-8282 / UCD 70-5) TaxID=1071381 RepID=G8BNV8_TETPH|nr:hypothetical protein TPHA_0A05110 [Tetrapisispora phaffii CBS 4417]CCE61586.1 hypothetical protein TPHA_0A05110 [Tetrapisispora phaffii CBS 4417]
MSSLKASTLFETMSFLIIVDDPTELEAATDIMAHLKNNSCKHYDLYKVYEQDDNITTSEEFLNTFGNKYYNQLISNTVNFSFYKIISYQFMVPVVEYKWVTACIESASIQRACKFSPNSKHFFKDFQFYISTTAFAKNDISYITELINYMGGYVTDILSSKVTHVVAESTDDPAITAVTNFNRNLDIGFVFVTWILLCFKKGQIVPIGEHEIKQNASYSIWAKKNNLAVELTNCPFSDKSSLLEGQKICVNNDIATDNELRIFTLHLLENYGATVASTDKNDFINTDNNDKYTCYLGYSESFVLDNKQIKHSVNYANISWILQMLSLDNFISPTINLSNSLLPEPLFNVNELILTYTTIYGQQRHYIKNLVTALGGKSTPTLSKRNTHLIFGVPYGKKYNYARSKLNKINVVNIKWLEQCVLLKSRVPENLFEKPITSNCFNDSSFIEHAPIQDEDKTDAKAEHLDIDLSQPNEVKEINGVLRSPAKIEIKAKNIEFSHSNDNSDEDESIEITQVTQLTPKNLQTTSNDNDEASLVDDHTYKNVNITSQNRSDTKNIDSKVLLSDEDKNNTDAINYGLNSNNLINSNFNGNENKTVFSETISGDAPTKTFETQREVKSRTERLLIGEDKDSIVDKGNISMDRGKNDSNVPIQFDKKVDVPIIPAEISFDQQVNQDAYSTKLSQNKENIKESGYDPFNSTLSPLTQLSSDAVSKSQNNTHNNELLNLVSSNTSSLNNNRETRSRKRKSSASQSESKDTESRKRRQSSRRSKDKHDISSDICNNDLSDKATKLLSEALDRPTYESLQVASSIDYDMSKNKIYDIRAVCTGCLENISTVDLELLKALGIHIYDKIDNSYNLNTIIAPKRMRTAKFLKSYSFQPLLFLLLPKFITDILSVLHTKTDSERTDIELDPKMYSIPKIDTELISKRSNMNTLVFERANIDSINLVSDIPGGTDVISSILKAHGIKNVNILSKQLTETELLENKPDLHYEPKSQKEHVKNYIVIANKASQVKRFRKHLNNLNSHLNEGDTVKSALVVEWNWCVRSIFNLEVDLNSNEGVIFQFP